jgi:DNA-binding CsgD family transcriptional regulator
VLAGAIAAGEDEKRPDLSRRERDVLRLLADGHTNLEIGKRLFISPETVRTHVAKLTAKLGAANRTHAVAKGLRASLIA